MRKSMSMVLVLILMLTSTSGFATEVPVEVASVYTASVGSNQDIETDQAEVAVSIPVKIYKDGELMTEAEVLSDSELRIYVLEEYANDSTHNFCEIDTAEKYAAGNVELSLPTDGVIGYTLHVEGTADDSELHERVEIRFVSVVVSPEPASPVYTVTTESNQYAVDSSEAEVAVSIPVTIYKDGVLMTEAEVLSDTELRLYVLEEYADDSTNNFCEIDTAEKYAAGNVELTLPTDGVIGYTLHVEGTADDSELHERVEIRFASEVVPPEPASPVYTVITESNHYTVDPSESEVAVSIPVEIYKDGVLMTEAEVLLDPGLRLYVLEEYADDSIKNFCEVDKAELYVDGNVELTLPTDGVIGYTLHVEGTADDSELHERVEIEFASVVPELMPEITWERDEKNYVLSDEETVVAMDIPLRFFMEGEKLSEAEVLENSRIELRLEKQLVGESFYEVVPAVIAYNNGEVHLELPTAGVLTYELVFEIQNEDEVINEGISIDIAWNAPPLSVTRIEIDEEEYNFEADATSAEFAIPVRFINGDVTLTDADVLSDEMIRIYFFRRLNGEDDEYYDIPIDYDHGVVYVNLPTENVEMYKLFIEVSNGIDRLIERIEIKPEAAFEMQYVGNYKLVEGEMYLEQDEPLQVQLINTATGQDETDLHELAIEGVDGATIENGMIRFPQIVEDWGYTNGNWDLLVDNEKVDEQSFTRYIGSLGYIRVVDPEGRPVVGEMNIYFALVNPEGSGSLYRNYSNETTSEGIFYLPINTDRSNIAVYGFAVSPKSTDIPYANSTFVNYTDYLATSDLVIDLGTVALQDPNYVAKIVDRNGDPVQGLVVGDLNAYYTEPETGLRVRFIVKAFGNNDGELAFANVYADQEPPYVTDELVMWATESKTKFEVADFEMPEVYTEEIYMEPTVSLKGAMYQPDGELMAAGLEFHVIAQPVEGGASLSEWSNGPSYEVKGLTAGSYRVWAITEHEWQKVEGVALLDSDAVIVEYDGITPVEVDFTMTWPHLMGSLTKDGTILGNRELEVYLYDTEGNQVDQCYLYGSEFFMGNFDLTEEGDYMLEIGNSEQDLHYGGQFIPVHLVPGEIVDLDVIELEESLVTGQIVADGFSGAANNMRGVYVNVFDVNGEFVKFAKSNSAGEFSVGNLPVGEYLLEAYVSPYADAATGYANSQKRLLVYDGSVEQFITLDLEPVAYEATVVSPFGEPLSDQWVKIYDENENLLCIVKSGSDGSIAIPYLDGSAVWMQALGNEMYVDSEMIRIEDQAVVSLQDTNLTCQIGNMEAANGSVEAMLLTQSGKWMQNVDVNEDGAFRFGGIEPGAYKIGFVVNGAVSMLEEVEVDGMNQFLVFDLPLAGNSFVNLPISEGMVQFMVENNIVGISAIHQGAFAVVDEVMSADAWIFSEEGLEASLKAEEWVGQSSLDFAGYSSISGNVIGDSLKYRIYLYDEDWNLIAMKKTNLLGAFAFNYVKPGMVHVDVMNGTERILTKEVLISGPVELDLDVR